MPHQLTRRQLLKALGITTAGVSLAAVGLHPDAPEASAAATTAKPIPHRYWWVKDVEKPSMEIDWKVKQRYREWRSTRGSLEEYRGPERTKEMAAIRANTLSTNERNAVPGYTLKDFALQSAVNVGRPGWKFMGPQVAKTPAERGMPLYTGSPEDNLRIIRAALRHMGAGTIGVVELEPETTRKLIYAEEPAPNKTRIDFEDVDRGYEDKEGNRVIIPNKARWAIVFTIQMSTETMKYGPTVLGSLTTALTYTRMFTITAQLQEFIHALGYNAYGPTAFNGLGIAPALGMLAGLGEMSRLNRIITPEYGPMVRCTLVVTDLPLEPTKPIRFGVMDFCKDCMTCADACPSGALSTDKEPTWETKGGWNNPGHKAYFEDSVRCRDYWDTCGTNCGTCFMSCPYAVDDEASLHRIIKGTIANTSFFNGLFVAGDRFTFPVTPGEPMKDPEQWWRDTNLAEMGIDTRRGGRHI